jgi:hypothetical protein
VANPIRHDPRGLSAILHAAQQMPTDAQPAAPATPTSLAPELLLGPGDAPDRGTYFDATTSATTGVRVIAHRARLPDYLDQRGRRTHRKTITLPPSTVARVQRATGSAGDNAGLNAALIGLAEYALARLEAEGLMLELRTPDDPKKAERLAMRRHVRTH